MFRFTIRDVIWLTVGVALALGWAIDRNRLASRAEALSSKTDALTAERDEARAHGEEAWRILTHSLPGPRDQ